MAVENAPLRTISDFKSRLQGGGARPNLFEVSIPNWPGSKPADRETLQFMAKATGIPAFNIAAIDIPFRGRQFKVAGDRTIDNWTVTVINDEEWNLRTLFEQWSEKILNLNNNSGTTNPNFYMFNGFVTQLGRGATKRSENSGNAKTNKSAVLAAYKFVDIWPVTVGDIALSYDTGDTIEEFDVEFAVQSIQTLPENDLKNKVISPIADSED
jgi:hypothetical protein